MSTKPISDEAIHEERGDNVERAATAVQDSGNIIKTQSTAIPNVPLPQGIGSGGRPRRQETMGDIPAQTRFKSLSKQSNDPPLSRVNTLGSGEDRLKLKELMDLCTKLSDRVLDLETTKTAQAKEIASLKKRVKKLERKRKSKTPWMKRLFKVGRSAQVVSSEDKGLGDQEDASKQGRKIDDIDKDAEVTLVDETQGRYGDDLVFDISVHDGEEVFAGQDVVENEVSTADLVTTAGEVVTTASVEVSAARATLVSAATTTTTTVITEVDLILAQALAELRSAKPKVVVQELVTTLIPIASNIKDKGKAKMIEPEKPLKNKEQIRLAEELAFKLQAEE
ncbi:hypothetical protein Tco_0540505 [Tanacetum coccineum]